MPWRCPVCGTENEDDVEFCVNCGAPRPSEGETGLTLAEPREAVTEPEEVEEAPQPEEPSSEVGDEIEEDAALTEAAEKEVVEAEAEEAGVPESLYLEIVNTPAHELIGKKIPLLFDVFPRITVGRSPESVIVIPDPTVSRRHAVIEKVDNKVVLRDLGSTNGTYIYNPETGGFERVEEIVLKPGLLIRLGESTIVRVVAE